MISRATAALELFGVKRDEEIDDALYVMMSADILREFFPDGVADELLMDVDHVTTKETVAQLKKLIESLDSEQRRVLDARCGFVDTQLKSGYPRYEMTDEELLSTVSKSSWYELALCAQVDGEVFEFPQNELDQNIRRDTLLFAKEVCARCVVQAYCCDEALDLTYPLNTGIRIAGGLGRTTLLRLRREAKMREEQTQE